MSQVSKHRNAKACQQQAQQQPLLAGQRSTFPTAVHESFSSRVSHRPLTLRERESKSFCSIRQWAVSSQQRQQQTLHSEQQQILASKASTS